MKLAKQSDRTMSGIAIAMELGISAKSVGEWVRNVADSKESISEDERAELKRLRKAIRKFRVTTDFDHEHSVSENVLARNFESSRPNESWTAEGWLYLAVMMNLSQRDVANEIRVPYQRVVELVNGRRGITPAIALRLAKFFGHTADFWMNLQYAGISITPSRAKRLYCARFED